VGAGPGDPELLTIKALRILRLADVVLHDALVSSDILQLASSRALIVDVGKRRGRKNISQDEINRLLIQFASSGHMVVRLKSGDPLVFGRAGEELDALQQAGIDVEIIPGVTTAVAAAATAQISLTDRRVAQQLLIISAHHAHDKYDDSNLFRMVSPRTTIVVYMPGEYGIVSERLRRAGLDSSTPCLLVSRVSTSEEQLFQTTLGGLPIAPVLPAPCILIVGATVARAVSQQVRAACMNYIPLEDESLLPAQSSDFAG
jgi:uroporphyrin-III C-methyltransferase